MKTSAVFGAAAVVLAVTTSARAQEAEVKGQGQATVTTPAVAAAPAATPRVAEPVTDDTPDHERFVGHFAVGYFGISQLPIATGLNGAGGAAALPGTAVAPTAGTVNAPIIGARYWFQRNIGVDAGIGLGMASGSSETVVGNGTVDTDHTSLFGFALHGGVPIAFAYGKHYTFELVPEATLGITSGTIKGVPAANGQAATADTSLSGFRLDVGARVGAEIHFGFIGVPELALEGSVGLYIRRNTIKAKQDQVSESDGSTTIGTSVGSDPWALFVNNISALYYF